LKSNKQSERPVNTRTALDTTFSTSYMAPNEWGTRFAVRSCLDHPLQFKWRDGQTL